MSRGLLLIWAPVSGLAERSTRNLRGFASADMTHVEDLGIDRRYTHRLEPTAVVSTSPHGLWDPPDLRAQEGPPEAVVLLRPYAHAGMCHLMWVMRHSGCRCNGHSSSAIDPKD